MKDEKLDEDDFDGQDLEQIRDRFSKGELVGVVLPVVVNQSTEYRKRFFSLY